jgi:hypothetical protein
MSVVKLLKRERGERLREQDPTVMILQPVDLLHLRSRLTNPQAQPRHTRNDCYVLFRLRNISFTPSPTAALATLGLVGANEADNSLFTHKLLSEF